MAYSSCVVVCEFRPSRHSSKEDVNPEDHQSIEKVTEQELYLFIQLILNGVDRNVKVKERNRLDENDQYVNQISRNLPGLPFIFRLSFILKRLFKDHLPSLPCSMPQYSEDNYRSLKRTYLQQCWRKPWQFKEHHVSCLEFTTCSFSLLCNTSRSWMTQWGIQSQCTKKQGSRTTASEPWRLTDRSLCNEWLSL